MLEFGENSEPTLLFSLIPCLILPFVWGSEEHPAVWLIPKTSRISFASHKGNQPSSLPYCKSRIVSMISLVIYCYKNKVKEESAPLRVDFLLPCHGKEQRDALMSFDLIHEFDSYELNAQFRITSLAMHLAPDPVSGFSFMTRPNQSWSGFMGTWGYQKPALGSQLLWLFFLTSHVMSPQYLQCEFRCGFTMRSQKQPQGEELCV